MRKIFFAFLALALALNLAFPEQAHAAMNVVPDGWSQSGDVIYKIVNNDAGIDRIEFSNWDRIGENSVQFSQNLTIENAEVFIQGPGFERAQFDEAPHLACIVIPNKEMTETQLANSVLRLRWNDGAYLQDGTPCAVVVTLTNFKLKEGTPKNLKAPLSILRTMPSQTIELQAFYNGRDGGSGVSCDVNVQIGIPSDAESKPESMAFTATDLDISDAGNFKGEYAESVEAKSGVLGTVYLQNNTYSDFGPDESKVNPLYGSDPNGRFLNLERIETSGGTWFSSTHRTTTYDERRAAGFATLVNVTDPGFDFTWRGYNCGTTLFMQAGLSPQLTVGNVGEYPARITTTDEQFAQRGQDGLMTGLYENPTNASRHSHTYKVHWKSQKTITAQADPGYRLSQVYVDPQISGTVIESEPINVADLIVGEPVAVGASTVTRNADGTVTVQLADKNPTEVGDATCFMNDHVVLFAAEIDTTSVSVTKRWEGGEAHMAIVDLLQNGVLMTSAELTAAGDWMHVFEALPQVDEQGNPYTYTVREREIPGFVAQVTGDATNGFTITNSADTTTTVDVSGSKVWNDAGNEDQRPQSITVRLLANGSATDYVQTVTADTGWTWTFAGVPKYDRGVEIEYAVTEDTVRDYSTVYDGNTIINTHNPEMTSLSVSKEWLYADGLPMADTTGLAPVMVQLVSRPMGSNAEFVPVEGRTLELSAEGAWRGVFEALPVRDGDTELEYAVWEAPVEGYGSHVRGDMISGFVITNTQTPPDVPFVKIAEDTQAVLPGALLMLTRDNGVQVSTWVSGDTPHVLSLVPGVYTLLELSAPEGYISAEPLEIVVAPDGTVTVGGAVTDEVRLVDPVMPVVPVPDPDEGEEEVPEVDPEASDPITPFDKETWGDQGDPQHQDATEMFEPAEDIVSIDLIDPTTNEPATGPINALDANGNVVGTYSIDENDLVTFTPNADFVGTARPATLRGTNADGVTSDAFYTPNVRPNSNTTTTTTTTTQPTVYTPNTGTSYSTVSGGGTTPTTADSTNSWAAVLFVIAAVGVLGGAFVLRKRA